MFWLPDRCEDAQQAIDALVEEYIAKYQAARQCLKKDHDTLIAFYDFAAGQ